MPEVIQRAFGALWPLMLALVIGYMAYDARIGPVSTFLVPSTWFLFSYMLVFPRSQPAAVLVYCLGKLNDARVKALIFIFATFLMFHFFYEYAPIGVIYMVAFGIIDFCVIQRNAYRAAIQSPILLLGDSRQPDTAAAEEEDSVNTTPDTVHESSLAAEPENTTVPDQSAEPEQPVEPDQPDNTDPSDGPSAEEVVQPKSWARSAMKILWSFLWSLLCVILKLGAAALVAHILIEVLLKGWALTPTPVDSAPLFEAEVIVQANKTQLPIPVPMAEFIPTGTFASPCQAAHTPTPVAKSIVTVMATPMPTPMPAPTPSAMPEPKPEPVAVPDEAFELLDRLFDFHIPDPKPLLTWYFDLPPSSQYAVIVASVLALWCLSRPLTILAPHLVVLAIGYFVAAAMLPLLVRYGFAPKQSMVITVAAECALTPSIWYAAYWLWNLQALCRQHATSIADIKTQSDDIEAQSEHIKTQSEYIRAQSEHIKAQSEDNASGIADLRSQFRDHDAGLTGLGNRFDEFVAQSKLGWAKTKSIAAIKKVLLPLVRCVIFIKTRADAQEKTVRHHATEIDALNKQMTTKADLYQTIRILEQLSDKIDGLVASKADAGALRAAQEEFKSLRSMVQSLQAEKVNAADLERVQQELQKLRGDVDDLRNTKADAKAVASVTNQVESLVSGLTEMRKAQDELKTGFGTLRTKMDDAQKDIASLHETSTQHGNSISRLDEDAKALRKEHNDLKSQVVNDRKNAKIMISELEQKNAEVRQENAEVRQENADLRRDVGELQGTVAGLKERMDAMDAKEAKHEQDLNQLRDDFTSGTDELSSEINSNHDKAMQANNDLAVTVDTRFAGLDEAVKKLDKDTSGDFQGLSKWTHEQAEKWKAIYGQMASTDKSLVDISKRVDAADDMASDLLKRVEAVESRPGDSVAEHQLDEFIRSRFEEYMENFLVSKRFWTVVEDTQLILKKQSNRERLRGQVQAAMEALLDTEEFQQNIYANFMERQALDNNLPVDPPVVVSGGRATLPGDISSDDNTGPTIPEESTIPDDVDNHHGTRGVPLGDPAEVCLRGRAASLGGSTSDGPSCDGGTGPRPSGEDDGDALQPKWREGNEPCEPGSLTDELDGPADPEQPGGEQDEETDAEDEEDDNDDEARDGGDDDESDDDGPPGPPPGSGGSNGHNGTGGNNNDGHDGDKGGAPRPFTGTGNFRGAPGLANSRYASDPSSDSATPPSIGKDGGPQDNNDDGAQDPSVEEHQDNPNKGLRNLNRMYKYRQEAVETAIARVKNEKQHQQQGQNLPAQAQNKQTSEGQLSKALNDLEHTHGKIMMVLDLAEQQNQLGPAQFRKPEARKLLKKGPGLLQEAKEQLKDLRQRLEQTENEQRQQKNENMQQENQNVQQNIEDIQQKIQDMLQKKQPVPSQSQPIRWQSQTNQLQNHPKQAQNQSTHRHNPPAPRHDHPSQLYNQPIQALYRPNPAQNRPVQPYTQPKQAQNQQTVEGQEQ